VPDFRRIQHRRIAKQRVTVPGPREGIDHQFGFRCYLRIGGFFTTLGLPALASGFRRDISTASETHSADIRQQYPSDLRVDYDFLQIFTAIPPLMFLVVSSFASKLLNWTVLQPGVSDVGSKESN
jgi:hypothetical protein